MRLGPAGFSKSDYEGRYRVSVVDDEGVSKEYFMTEAELAAKSTEKDCGPCCHRPSSFVIIGQVKDGKLNGTPIEHIVRVKESGW